MNKLLVRIASLMLIPCLAADPATASSFANQSLSPARERAACPPTLQRRGARGTPAASALYNQQALVAALNTALFRPNRFRPAHLFESLKTIARDSMINPFNTSLREHPGRIGAASAALLAAWLRPDLLPDGAVAAFVALAVGGNKPEKNAEGPLAHALKIAMSGDRDLQRRMFFTEGTGEIFFQAIKMMIERPAEASPLSEGLSIREQGIQLVGTLAARGEPAAGPEMKRRFIELIKCLLKYANSTLAVVPRKSAAALGHVGRSNWLAWEDLPRPAHLAIRDLFISGAKLQKWHDEQLLYTRALGYLSSDKSSVRPVLEDLAKSGTGIVKQEARKALVRLLRNPSRPSQAGVGHKPPAKKQDRLQRRKAGEAHDRDPVHAESPSLRRGPVRVQVEVPKGRTLTVGALSAHLERKVGRRRILSVEINRSVKPPEEAGEVRVTSSDVVWFHLGPRMGEPPVGNKTNDPAAEKRFGQKAIGRSGITQEQARRLAARLENRVVLKPRRVPPGERSRIGDAIEALVKDRKNERSRILRDRLGVSLWYKLYDLADLLRRPEPVVVIGGVSYRYDVRSIPDSEPMEFEGEWLWGFPVIEEPSEKGDEGRIILYVPDPEGYPRDPEKLAGLIHEALQYLIFPQDPAIPEDQRHPLAVILEAVAGGQIADDSRFSARGVIPRRVEREIELIPGQADRLVDWVRNTEASEEINRKFPSLRGPGAAVNAYLFGLLMAARSMAIRFPRSRRPVPPLPAGWPPVDLFAFGRAVPVNYQRRQEAMDLISAVRILGGAFLEIHDMKTGTSEYFPSLDAQRAAEEGFLLVKREKDNSVLCWGTNGRMGRVGGRLGPKQYENSRTVRFEGESIVAVGKHRFKVWVEPVGPPAGRTVPKFRLVPGEERLVEFDFDKEFQVGRIHGDYFNTGLGDLDPRHFSVKVTRAGQGGYQLEIKNKSAQGTLFQWVPSPVEGHGSPPVANFMGTGLVAHHLALLTIKLAAGLKRFLTRQRAVRVFSTDRFPARRAGLMRSS